MGLKDVTKALEAYRGLSEAEKVVFKASVRARKRGRKKLVKARKIKVVQEKQEEAPKPKRSRPKKQVVDPMTQVSEEA